MGNVIYGRPAHIPTDNIGVNGFERN